MTKYKFSNTERFVVWKAYDCKCFWCGEPLEHKQTTIDHVFPEKLLDSKIDFDRMKHFYSLPNDFQINEFCNWVPSHNNCNNKKSYNLITNSPAFLMIVESIIKKSSQVKKAYDNLTKQISKDKLLMKLLSDLEKNKITNEDLILLLNDTSKFYIDIPEVTEDELTHVPAGWKVMSINRQLGKLRVVSGNYAGDVPIEIMPDNSWICPTCQKYGPWDGNKCASCGHYNSPFE